MPAFGEADLSNCEREQIHLAGSIQPHGVLLLVREPEHTVVQASANAAAFLGLRGGVLGKSLRELGGNLHARISTHLGEPLTRMPKAVRCRAGADEELFDGLVHRQTQGSLIIELERAGPPVDLSRHIDLALQSVLAAPSLKQLCDETARLFRELTGYDRVMVYRFDDDGHGEVFSELRNADLEPYLGNRYPASDIPQIARRLYERNRVRVLVDAGYEPVPLEPRVSPFSGTDLDMSLCVLRSMSPIHVQYLKNMGVAATLVVSLMVGGRLWGLVACHHYVPRFVNFEVRAVCELQAEAVATRISALESFQQNQSEIYVRRLEQRMIDAISREGDWRIALFDGTGALLKPVEASGVALIFEGQVLTAGDVPSTQRLREIGIWLDGNPPAPVISTASLGLDMPQFAELAPVASGVLAAALSNSPGEYLVWFRPERVRTVTWGGNPFKPVLVGNDPLTLSPRRSFSQWHQLVEKTSDPWSPADLITARQIGETVADVVLQFRTLRVLIAQDQLDQIRHQVRGSDQPVVIADRLGRILLRNEAFDRLLQPSQRHLQRIEDLPALFVDAREAARNIHDLVSERHTWRGEVAIPVGLDARRSFMVRGDPVFSSPGRVLGFILLLTDLTERKAADAARQRFQEGIITGQRVLTGRLNSNADMLFQNLLSAVVENAQLAALEITDGADVTRMPDLLDGVRASVGRTAEVLQHLIWHATDESTRS